MSVMMLTNRTTSQWAAAEQALQLALPVAGHPRLTEHAEAADRFLADAGAPSRIWANRIAAIAVIAERRADAAPTIARRAAYLDVAAAASALLALAHEVHCVQPDELALAVLAETGRPLAALV